MADQRRIYIADDDDNIRQVIRTFLQSDGYLVEDFPPATCCWPALPNRAPIL